MRPLASRLRKALSLGLIFCLLPWQEPARAFAEAPVAPAADPRAELALATLPPAVKDEVEKILQGPGGAAFAANARAAKLPEIRALLVQVAAAKDPADPALVAARGQLDALVAAANGLKHDWKGDADAEKAYLDLLAEIAKERDAISAADPIMARLREQVAGRPELEGQLQAFQGRLAAYMKSGSDADMASAVRSMDKIYLDAGIHDDGARAKLFSEMGAAARAQSDALAQGGGRPFTGYQGEARKVTDQGIVVPNMSSGTAVGDAGTTSATGSSTELRDAVGAASAGLRDTALGGLVPGADLRALADRAAKLAERLGNPRAAAAAEDARNVAKAYDDISGKIMRLISEAPEADGKDSPALKAWRASWADLQRALLDRDGKPGPEWARVEKAWADHPEAQSGAAASRSRAAELRRMLGAFAEKGIDPSAVSKDLRGKLLTGDGDAGSLGLVTQAIFHDQDQNGAKLKALLARAQELGLLAPGADPQALARFYDAEGSAELFKGTPFEGLVARWDAARKQEASGTAAAAPGPTSAELSAQILEQVQFLGTSTLAEKNDAKKQAALLYLRQYNLNQSVADYLRNPPAEHGPLNAREKEFLAGFDKASKGPKDARGLAEQQRLTDLVRPLLTSFKEIGAMERADAASRELNATLNALPRDVRDALQSMPGAPDIRNLAARQAKEPVIQWTLAAKDLGLYKGSEDDWTGLQRQVAADYYTEGYQKAVSAQSARLTEQSAAFASAPSEASARAVGQTLNGIVNPGFLTSGFVAALPALLSRSADASKRVSSRDQQILDAWTAIKAKLLEAASKAQAQAPDAAALIRKGAENPADAEALTEALRLAGFSVYDERLLRVAMNPAAASADATGRDGAALRQLLLQYRLKPDDPGLAAKLTAALAKDLGGDLAKRQEAFRVDQLLRSTSDETRDQLDRLQASVAEFRSSEAYAKQRAALGAGSLKELESLAAALRNNAAASDAASALARADSGTAEGRLRQQLASRFLALKAQSALSINFRSSDRSINDGMEGFTVSGWLIGRPDAAKVVRRVHHETSPGSVERGAVRNEITGETIAGPPRGPKGGRDGLTFELGRGESDFASLDGRRIERTRNVVVENPMGSGPKVRQYVDSSGVTVYREVLAGGRLGPAFEKDPLGRRARPDADAKSLHPVQTVSVMTRAPGGSVRPDYTVTQYRTGRGQTVVTKLLKPGPGADSFTEVDYVRRSLFERRGGRAVEYQLDAKGTGLAESRGRTVFETVDGKLTPAYSESIDPRARVLSRTVLNFDASITPTYTMTLGAGTAKDGSLKGLSQAEIDRRLRDGVAAKLSNTPSSASVRVDPARFKTPQARSAELARVGARLQGMGLLGDGNRVLPDAVKLMSFYDGARGQGNVADVSFRFSSAFDGRGRSGSVGVSTLTYDRATRKTAEEYHNYDYHADLPASVGAEPIGNDSQPAHRRAVEAVQAQNVLAMIRRHAGLSSAYVETQGGRPVAFFATSGTLAAGRHTVGVGGKEGEDSGHWYHAADITRSFTLDGKVVDRFKVGETTSMWNGGAHLGEYVNNDIRDSDWGQRHPMWAAVAGGVAGGAISGLLDPKMLAITALTMGSGYIVGVLAETTSGGLVLLRTSLELVNAGAHAYFQATMIVGGAEAAYHTVSGVVRQDANELNSGVMSGSSLLIMLGAFKGAEKLGVPGFARNPGEREGGTEAPRVEEHGAPEQPKPEAKGTPEPAPETRVAPDKPAPETPAPENRGVPEAPAPEARPAPDAPRPEPTRSAPEPVPETRAAPEAPRAEPRGEPRSEPGTGSGAERAPAPRLDAGAVSDGGNLSHPAAADGVPSGGGGSQLFGEGGAKAAKGPGALAAPEPNAPVADAKGAAPVKAPAAQPVAPADAAAPAKAAAVPDSAGKAAPPAETAASAETMRAGNPVPAETLASAPEGARFEAPPREAIETARRQADVDRFDAERARAAERLAQRDSARAEREAARKQARAEDLRGKADDAKREVEKAREGNMAPEGIRQIAREAARADKSASAAADAALKAGARAESLKAAAAERGAAAKESAAREAASSEKLEALKQQAADAGKPIVEEGRLGRLNRAARDWTARRDAGQSAREGKAAEWGWAKALNGSASRLGDLSFGRLKIGSWESGEFSVRNLVKSPVRAAETFGVVLEHAARAVDGVSALARLAAGRLGEWTGSDWLKSQGKVAYDPVNGYRLHEVKVDGRTEMRPVEPGMIDGLLGHVGRALQGRFMPDGKPIGSIKEIWYPERSVEGAKAAPESAAPVKSEPAAPPPEVPEAVPSRPAGPPASILRGAPLLGERTFDLRGGLLKLELPDGPARVTRLADGSVLVDFAGQARTAAPGRAVELENGLRVEARADGVAVRAPDGVSARTDFEIGDALGDRGNWIAGGRSRGRAGGREEISVDWTRDAALEKFYQEILSDAGLTDRAGTLTPSERGELLGRVFEKIRSRIDYDADHVSALEERYRNNEVLLGDAAITPGKGVCRHMGLVSAAILERLGAEGYLGGDVYYVRGKGHGWAVYETRDGTRHVFDVAQRDYVVPMKGSEYYNGRGYSSYASAFPKNAGRFAELPGKPVELALARGGTPKAVDVPVDAGVVIQAGSARLLVSRDGAEYVVQEIGDKGRPGRALEPGRPLVVGRDPGPDGYEIASRRSDVSRRHLELLLEDGKVSVADLGSRSGTVVRFEEEAPARPRDMDATVVVRVDRLRRATAETAADKGAVPHLSEESAAEPESPLVLPTPEKLDGLRQLKKSLEARKGEGAVLALIDKIYYTDPLTGLPNRAFFIDRAQGVLESAKDPAVAMLDMNNFGAVNVGLSDLHGVTKGRARADELLGIAGATLGKLAKAHKVTVVRLGGEEFVALGARDAVVEFSAAAKKTLTPERLLDEAGMTRGTPEREAIASAMQRMGRGGQPVGDFTYGVAELRGRPVKDATTAADHALGHGKDAAGRGSITLETPEGYRDWTKESESARLETLPRAPPNRTIERLEALEKRLTPQERKVFQEATFKDPLTLTRSYEYLTVKERDWNKFYAEGGMVMLSSARNLKQINDILGHDAGDLYLRKLGVVMRQAINKARIEKKLDVQEPVRVASKEFMLVGKDAKLVSELAARAVAESFDGGRMLTPEQVEQVRREAVKRGHVTEEGAKLIGTLRAVEEPIREQGGRADVRAALDRAFVSLEELKNAETKTGARGANSLPPPPDRPAPPLRKVMKPGDVRPAGIKIAPEPAEPVAPELARYERYFTPEELLAAHPSPETGGAYHDWRHTVKVADMAREFARARGLSPADAKFISEVGLLHDFDPDRAPGMPARVPATLERLRQDYAGTKSLTGEPGHSILKERFGWTPEQFKMAEAMIQRTEFPFGDTHPSPAYKGTSPLAVYEGMLKDMPAGDRKFVLREGALLSEYADKSSWYATEDFDGAREVVEGLVDEINRSAGKPVMDAGKLGTDGFLKVVGEPDSFKFDRALAEKFGVELTLPSRAEAFKLLPAKYGRAFESNLEGFRVLNEALKANDPAALDKARAAAEQEADRLSGDPKVLKNAALDPAARRAALQEIKAADLPGPETLYGRLADPVDTVKRLLGMRLLSDEQVDAVMRAHDEVPCAVFRCSPAQLLKKIRILDEAGVSPVARRMLIREGFAGSEEKPVGGKSVEGTAPALSEAQKAAALAGSEELSLAESGGVGALPPVPLENIPKSKALLARPAAPAAGGPATVREMVAASEAPVDVAALSPVPAGPGRPGRRLDAHTVAEHGPQLTDADLRRQIADGKKAATKFSSEEAMLKSAGKVWSVVEKLGREDLDLSELSDVRALDPRGRPLKLEQLAADFWNMANKTVAEVTIDVGVGEDVGSGYYSAAGAPRDFGTPMRRVRATLRVEGFRDRARKPSIYIKTMYPVP